MSLRQEDIIHTLLSDRVRLLAYIRTFVFDRDAAEDIHQEVVIQALHSLDAIEDVNHLLGWARRTAKLKSYEYFRRLKNQPKHLDPDVLELLEPIWEEERAQLTQTTAAALNLCLDELTPRSRELIRLRFADRLSGLQIATTLNLKVHSVYVSLSRIYHALNDCVRRKISIG